VTFELHEADVELQGGVGEQTYEVGLGGNLDGHEVEDDDAQGAYVLMMGPRGVHHEDVLMLQQLYCREAVG